MTVDEDEDEDDYVKAIREYSAFTVAYNKEACLRQLEAASMAD